MDDLNNTEGMKQADTPLQSVLDQIETALDGADCGLCMMTPLGAIPGLPPAFGLIVIVFALQLLFRRRSPWMPEVLRKVKIPADKLSKVQAKVRPILAKIDGIISPRLQWASTGVMQIVVSLIAIILSLTFFPLGMVPFGVVAPATIVLLLGLGITARDGILILIGLSLSLGVFVGVAALFI